MARATCIDDVKNHLQPVIVGGDILAYSYVRELHRAYGITRSIVLATQDIKMLSTSNLTDYRLIGGLYDTAETFYFNLEKIAVEVYERDPEAILLVLGCDDVHARLLSSGKKRLQEIGYTVPYIDFELLDSITQKKQFYEICEELGVPYPKTWYLDCAEGPETLSVDEFTFPLIAKPSNSAQFQDATIENKRKIYEIESEEELQQVWHSIRTSDYNNLLIIQDFIPGDDDAIRTLTTFSDAEGNLRVVSGGVVALQDHDPTALGNPLAIIGEKEQVIVDNAAKILKHITYRGFANFDIKYDNRDDSFRFFEVNTRCGRNTYYMSLGGVNFVTLIVREFILGEPIEEIEAYNPFLFCCVPDVVLKKSISNKVRLSQALELRKQTNDPYPLHYTADSIKHNGWAQVMFENQIRKFKKFYWDTDGKQLK